MVYGRDVIGRLPGALVVGDALGLGGAGGLGGESEDHQGDDVGYHVVDVERQVYGGQERVLL